MTSHPLPVQRANIGTHFRALGLRGQSALIDPFINVDHAWMSAPTFPPHPHAGFSAVSYVFLDSETGIENRDSLGSHNLIRPGGLHWVTAGSGVVHQEDPAEPGKTVHSLQIFVALPSDMRDMDPFTLTLEPGDVPLVRLPGAAIRVPLGRFAQARSPLNPPTDVTMLDISLEAGAAMSVPIPAGENAFVMPIFGTVLIDGKPYRRDDLMAPLFRAQAGSPSFTIAAADTEAKVMVFSAKPFGR